jgi:pyridoxal phosphate enzyme (YggS family)
MESITERSAALPRRLERVRENLARAAGEASRDPAGVTIVAVTKTLPVEVIRAAVAAGLEHFGENRIQEALPKIEALADERPIWHLVGHLQTNKARLAAGAFAMVESVDSERVAAALQQRLEHEDRTLEVLVQVNTSGEETKYGLAPGDLRPLLERMVEMDRLQVKGLMTIAPFDDRENVVRPCFAELRRLRDEAREWALPGCELTELSMGMSGDYEWAVAEGATIVRLGSVLFGRRGA